MVRSADGKYFSHKQERIILTSDQCSIDQKASFFTDFVTSRINSFCHSTLGENILDLVLNNTPNILDLVFTKTPDIQLS